MCWFYMCLDAMLQVADRLSRPYSVDAAVSSLPKRIADAILYMQDNLNTFNSKVWVLLSDMEQIQDFLNSRSIAWIEAS